MSTIECYVYTNSKLGVQYVKSSQSMVFPIPQDNTDLSFNEGGPGGEGVLISPDSGYFHLLGANSYNFKSG